MLPCSHVSPINNHKTMSKRQMQEEKPEEEERVVAKSKPMMSLVSKTANRLQEHRVRVHLTARGRSMHTVRIQTVPVRRDPLREVE